MNYYKKEDVLLDWDWEITSKRRWFNLELKDLVYYRSLILRFVRRDLIANFKQTIIGPIWIFLQPLLTTLIYIVVFGNIAQIPTDGIPKILFYLSGSIIWSFYFESLSGTMYTFITNSHIFSKVYFPRLVMPISNIITQVVRLLIQAVLFIIIFLYYHIALDMFTISASLIIIPFLILLTGLFALGGGLLISVITAKYRDIDNLMQHLLRLFMFATPIVFPSSMVPEKYKVLLWMNPLTPIMETLRAVLFNQQSIPFDYLLLAVVEITVILIVGLILFKKREIQVMDII